MHLSQMKGYTTAIPVELGDLDQIAEFIIKTDWSAGTFKDQYREADNFIGSDLMPIDIDEGMTIPEAKEIFKDYSHIIATTRSHQKEKNGVIADRFRVVLVLDTPITRELDYNATYKNLCEIFTCIDPSCSDGSRLFYRSVNIVSVNKTGRRIGVVNAVDTRSVNISESQDVTPSDHGRMSHVAKEFFLEGPRPGPVNTQLFKACKEAQQAGYDSNWVMNKIQHLIDTTNNWPQPEINKVDLKTIKSAFNKPAKHEPRAIQQDSPLKFLKMKELKKEASGIEWSVDNFLTSGGISVWAGDPKAGKSTIVRQLCLAISRGNEFLGRTTTQGHVLYMSLEEQVEMIAEQFEKQGLTDEDPVYVHTGPVGVENPISYLQELLENEDVKFLVIDTLGLFLNVENLNNYSQVNKAIAPYRNLARQTNTHIMFIHHTNKNTEGSKSNKIMGSNALFGAVDNAILFESGDKIRFITSFQRGGKAFLNQPLKYHPETLTYTAMENNDADDF